MEVNIVHVGKQQITHIYVMNVPSEISNMTNFIGEGEEDGTV